MMRYIKPRIVIPVDHLTMQQRQRTVRWTKCHWSEESLVSTIRKVKGKPLRPSKQISKLTQIFTVDSEFWQLSILKIRNIYMINIGGY